MSDVRAEVTGGVVPLYNDGMATKKKDTRLGWHFLNENMKLGYGDGRKAEVGKTLSIPTHRTPACCDVGMHASERISQAASFQVGPVMTRVLVSGDIDTASDKFCGRSRKVLWAGKLDAKILKKVIKAIGGDDSSDYVPDLVHELGNLADDEDHAPTIDKMLLKWANSKGLDGSPVEITFVKKALTKEIVKGFLAQRLVRTQEEIVADIGEAYDVNGDESGNSSLDDILSDLNWDNEICTVDSFAADGSDGYVLKQKKTPTKKKLKRSR